MADSGKRAVARLAGVPAKAPRPAAVTPTAITVDAIREPAPFETAATDVIDVVKTPARPSAADARTGSTAGIHAVPTRGDRIGTYVVERQLGSGGMGLVVAARHETRGDVVAIKLLRPKAAYDQVQSERFAREARAIVKIKSEHVVRVFDVGTLDSGAPYIVMEYLVGRDLAQILHDEGPMDLRRAADLMLQVCEAVASAHAASVIHRDLKPSNFFVTTRPDGSSLVKVLDFGISKATGTEARLDPTLTETQAVFGSPTYMSPEQIRSSKHVDQRSDIWSLGVALYESVTGRLPFAGDNVAGVLASIVADPPFFPRAFAPHLPAELEELLLALLAKDPKERVQSVAEVAFRLAPFASQNVETQTLLDRIGRLSDRSAATLLSSNSGNKLEMAELALETHPSAPPARPRADRARSLLVSVGIGLVVALIGGGLIAYRVSSRAAPIAPSEPPIPSTAPIVADTAPPVTATVTVPPPPPPLASASPSAAAPTAEVGGAGAKPGPGVPPKKPARHGPARAAPITTAAAPAKTVDPTNDRF